MRPRSRAAAPRTARVRNPQTYTPRPRPGAPPIRRTTILFAVAASAGIVAPGAMASMPASLPKQPVAAAPSASAGVARTAWLPRRTTQASAYSAWDEGNFCPGHPQTRKMDLTVGSDLVPCGAHVRICLPSGKRCVVAQRRDWGPGLTARRRLDLNLGVVRALGFRSLYHWGVRTVRWEPAAGPVRRAALTR
jgi:hypothetical protein